MRRVPVFARMMRWCSTKTAFRLLPHGASVAKAVSSLAHLVPLMWLLAYLMTGNAHPAVTFINAICASVLRKAHPVCGFAPPQHSNSSRQKQSPNRYMRSNNALHGPVRTFICVDKSPVKRTRFTGHAIISDTTDFSGPQGVAGCDTAPIFVSIKIKSVLIKSAF